jgi:hypothetical protein
MSAQLRNADCSPPQAQPAAGVAIFLGKFNYFLIKKKPSGLLGFLGYWFCLLRVFALCFGESINLTCR